MVGLLLFGSSCSILLRHSIIQRAIPTIRVSPIPDRGRRDWIRIRRQRWKGLKGDWRTRGHSTQKMEEEGEKEGNWPEQPSAKGEMMMTADRSEIERERKKYSIGDRHLESGNRPRKYHE